MQALSPEISALLDRLYNLRGEHSVILVDIDKQRDYAMEVKLQTTEEKKELQNRIQELEQLYNELNTQGDKLNNLLSNINREDYAVVLEQLDIDFNPQDLLEKLTHSLPEELDTITTDTKKAEKQLAKVQEDMDEAIKNIDELSTKRDSALVNQEKLNEYIDLALSGRISITRDSIVSLLEQFNFTEEEAREAAKILMFPEDALFAYDEKIKEKEQPGKSISDVFTEAKNADPIEEENTDTFAIIEEEPVAIEAMDTDYVSEINDVSDTDDANDMSDHKEDLINLLSNNGINYLDFTGQDMDNLMDHFDADIIEKNIKFIRNSKVGTEIFVNHTDLMLDENLVEKVNMLLNVGKEPIDIYLNPNVLEKYTKEELEDIINNIKENGMDPKNVPLMAY